MLLLLVEILLYPSTRSQCMYNLIDPNLNDTRYYVQMLFYYYFLLLLIHVVIVINMCKYNQEMFAKKLFYIDYFKSNTTRIRIILVEILKEKKKGFIKNRRIFLRCTGRLERRENPVRRGSERRLRIGNFLDM